MHQIWTLQELEDSTLPPVNASSWTAIIPAAGKGSRLQFHLPKLLFPIGNKPILHRLLDLIAGQCSRLILVLNRETQPLVMDSVRSYYTGEVASVIQEQPRGMADAILAAKAEVSSSNVFVLWGDQVTLRRRTLDACQRLHQSVPKSALTLPTVLKDNPYIHFERDSAHGITKVLEARECPIPLPVGESDCGLFCFQSALLWNVLQMAQQQQWGIGSMTREFNLLPLLPLFQQFGSVNSLRIEDAQEALGVNTPSEAASATEILARRES